MTDTQWRASVRADAIRQGYSTTMADFLAARVGKQPTQAEREMSSPHTSKHGARAARTTTPAARSRALTVDDRRTRICALYRAPTLAQHFKREELPLRTVAAILANANNGHTLTAAGCANVRTQLTANNYWRAS